MSLDYSPTAGYPGPDALAALLCSMGLLSQPTTPTELLTRFVGATEGAASEWERQTNWFPFWSGGSGAADISRTFDNPPVNPQISGAANGGSGSGIWGSFYGGTWGRNYDLDLESGLVSFTTCIAGVTGYTIGGPAPIQNYLLPQNALVKKSPYRGVRFTSRPAAIGPQSIVITGRWGFCDVLPPDVWNAILGQAAREVVPMLSAMKRGTLESWTAEDASQKKFEKPYDAALTQWQTEFRIKSVRYRRYPLV